MPMRKPIARRRQLMNEWAAYLNGAARHRRFASPLTRRRSGPPPRTHRARLTPTAPARLQFRTAPYPAVPRAVRSSASA